MLLMKNIVFAIRFYLILLKKASYLIPNSRTLYLSNLVQRAWFLIPNSPINHSVVRIFIVPGMRLLNSDDAFLHKPSC